MAENTVPQGYRFAGVSCGLKKVAALDLALIASDRPCAAAAVFTQNRFPAAPVLYDKELLATRAGALQAVAVNAGIANACTGEAGLADAAEMARLVEAALDLPGGSAAVMSTGVIGPRLKMDRIAAGLKEAASQLAAGGAPAASQAIMTTDTRPKLVVRQAGPATILGMAKGAGMIHPDMATMLSVIVTDAQVEPAVLQSMLHEAVSVSFNCISIDGDTSTNDTVLLLANGAAGAAPEAELRQALRDLCTDLAQQIVRDGEGATRFISIRIEGAASDPEAHRAANAIATSPLVKTAFYGGDANWGRILAAVGYSGVEVQPERAGLWIGAGALNAGDPARDGKFRLQLVAAGQPLDYSEQEATAIFAGKEIAVLVDLGLGEGRATVWTCDLSHEYVNINGHYRT